MRNQWLASEHHRLHIVEDWPEGPYKDATLRAIHSSIEGISGKGGMPAGFPECEVCLSRRRSSSVVRFPVGQQGERAA
jgi:hypothetical protein